jgi:hypothetical protein
MEAAQSEKTIRDDGGVGKALAPVILSNGSRKSCNEPLKESEHTADKLVRSAHTKHAGNRTQAVAQALRLGLIS